MKLTNDSPYDTRTLRRVIELTAEAITESRSGHEHRARIWFASVHFEVKTKRSAGWWWRYTLEPSPRVELRLQQLTGNEFIVLLRQQHAPDTAAPLGEEPLLTAIVALATQQVMMKALHWKRQRGRKGDLMNCVQLALGAAKTPKYLPIRKRRVQPTDGELKPRNIVQERYERVLELEKKWTRKRKLADTKLKKLRLRRKHYEKKLTAVQQPSEE